MADVIYSKKLFDNKSVTAGTYSDNFYINLADSLTLFIKTDVDAEIVLQVSDGYDWQNIETIETSAGSETIKHYIFVWGHLARLLVNTDCTITAKYMVKR